MMQLIALTLLSSEVGNHKFKIAASFTSLAPLIFKVPLGGWVDTNFKEFISLLLYLCVIF